MPARNSAASARGDAPGQNRQARPRLINLFPSHPISLWWHIGRQAEMYDYWNGNAFWMQVSEAALATLQECREKKFKGCSAQFQTLEVKRRFCSEMGIYVFFAGPGRHQPLLVSFSRRLPPCSWEGEDSQPGARTPYKGKMMMLVLNGAGGRIWWSKAMLIINNHSHLSYSVNLNSKICTANFYETMTLLKRRYSLAN